MAIWVRLQADLRTSWRAWLGLALLIGFFGGAVLGALAGAHRTETAYPRFLAASRDRDVLVALRPTEQEGTWRGTPEGFYDEIARLPEVVEVGHVALMQLFVVNASGEIDPVLFYPAASVDGRIGYTMERLNLVSGRLPRRDQANEALATPRLAEHLRLEVGSTLNLRAFSGALERPTVVRPDAGTPVSLKIVGIGVGPGDVVPSLSTQRSTLLVTPAYYEAHRDTVAVEGAALRLRPGTDPVKLKAAIDAIATRYPEARGQVQFATTADRNANVRRAIRPQAVALLLFGLLLGATAFLVIEQALSRQLLIGASDYPILRALGMTRGELVAQTMISAACVAVIGAAVAVAVAALSSSLMPIGPARLAEPHPGFAVNTAVIGLGFVAVVLLVVAGVAPAAWRAASRPGDVSGRLEMTGSRSPSRLAEAVARSGLPPTAGVGVRMAVEPGRGRTAVPVRSALAGNVVALASVVAAFTFVANLQHLVNTPRLYGWDWNLAVDTRHVPAGAGERVRAVLAGSDDVADLSASSFENGSIGGLPMPVLRAAPLQGDLVIPALLEGRAPAGPDEIALGTKTLRRAHLSIGESAPVQLGDGERRMRVVGRVVFPAFGGANFSPSGLGEGAVITGHAGPSSRPMPTNAFFLARYGPGADPAAVSARLIRELAQAGCSPPQCDVFRTLLPPALSNYSRLRWTPLGLAGLLVLLALSTLGHTIVMSIRRRGHDFAILKAMGFVRHQVAAAVAWQSTTLAILALIVGLPLGVIAGRWLWRVFAEPLGVSPEPLTTLSPVLLAIPVTVVVANLLAAWPGRTAAGIQPAAVLRTE